MILPGIIKSKLSARGVLGNWQPGASCGLKGNLYSVYLAARPLVPCRGFFWHDFPIKTGYQIAKKLGRPEPCLECCWIRQLNCVGHACVGQGQVASCTSCVRVFWLHHLPKLKRSEPFQLNFFSPLPFLLSTTSSPQRTPQRTFHLPNEPFKVAAKPHNSISPPKYNYSRNGSRYWTFPLHLRIRWRRAPWQDRVSFSCSEPSLPLFREAS